MGVEHRTARVAQGVHRPEPLLEGGSSPWTPRPACGGAGGEVGPVRDGGGERPVDEAHPFERDPLREGMERRARERFEAVGRGRPSRPPR